MKLTHWANQSCGTSSHTDRLSSAWFYNSRGYGDLRERLKVQKIKRLSVASVLLAGMLTTVAANEDVAEYRHLMMESVGAHMKSANMILRGRLENQDHLQMHADALAELADIVPTLFTEGSEGGEALDVIWEEPEEFAKRVEAFQSATQDFAAAVTDGDQSKISEAFRGVGMSCKGCHDRYREE